MADNDSPDEGSATNETCRDGFRSQDFKKWVRALLSYRFLLHFLLRLTSLASFPASATLSQLTKKLRPAAAEEDAAGAYQSGMR